MTYECIRFGMDGGIARLMLNRPDKLNSFNVAMHEEIRDALDSLESESGVRVLLLTGAGRAFCAGQDLGDRSVSPGGERTDLGESVDKYYAPLVRRIRSLALPIVCGVNGTAAGAGANLALACDLAIAKRSAKFVEPFCRLGLIPDTGGTYFLPRRIGTARAMGLAMLGEPLGAEQAADWGLIWRCVDDEAYDEALEKLLAHLAAAPTRGLAETKRLIHASADNSLDTQLDLERDAMRELGYSHD